MRLESESPAGALSFGSGIGAAITTFFGFMWLGWGLGVRSSTTVTEWIVYDILALALFIASVLTIRAGKLRMNAPLAPRNAFWEDARKPYRQIIIGEALGCVVVAGLAIVTHHQELLALGISAVVGLHFIPLGLLFRVRAYIVTGIAVVLCDLLSWVYFRSDDITVAVGIATGAILWITAVYMLLRARRTLAAS